MFRFYRADLANLVNEAALLAGRKSKTTVDRIDFIQAVERSIAVSHILSQCVDHLVSDFSLKCISCCRA